MAKPTHCNDCSKTTHIRRDYSLGILITLIVLFGPFSLIYYWRCKWQCQICKGYDLGEPKFRMSGSGPSDSGGPSESGGASAATAAAATTAAAAPAQATPPTATA